MDASPIGRILSVLVAVTSVQVVCTSGAIAADISTGTGVVAISSTVVLPSLQSEISSVSVEVQQFVPPDTGGPDQTGSTGTR